MKLKSSLVSQNKKKHENNQIQCRKNDTKSHVLVKFNVNHVKSLKELERLHL